MVNFKEIYHFSRFQRGSNIFQGGGSNVFHGGGGESICLFPIETHITCYFPGGGGPLSPPLDPHLCPMAEDSLQSKHINVQCEKYGFS